LGKEVSAIAADELTPDPSENPPELPPSDSQEDYLRASAVMSIGTTLSRLTGFLRTAVMAATLGITINKLADAYNVANTTPNIVYELALGGVLSSAFLPVFVDWMQSNGRDAAWDVANRVMTLTAVLLSALALLGVVIAPWIINLYWPEFRGTPSGELAAFFLRWFMPQIVFYGIGAVASGLLQANRRFAAPMFAPILNNLVVIATFATFAVMPGPNPASPANITFAQKTVLGLGTTLGIVTMTAALWPSLRRIGYRWRPTLGFRHEAVTRIAHLAKWTIVYVVVNQLGYLSVIRLAGPNTGVLTAYTYAFIFFQLPHAIFAVSIFTALMPSMSGRWAAGDRDGYRRLLGDGIRTTACIVIPASLGYVALSLPIIRLLLQYGNNNAHGSQLTASILAVMALGLFPFSLFQLALRAFYAMQDTRTPALINIAAAAANIGINVALYPFFGARGLAIGFVSSYLVAVTIALVMVRKRAGGLGGRRTIRTIGRVLIAGILTAVVAWLAAAGLGALLGTAGLGARLVQVIGGVLAGLLVFGASARILRIDEVDAVRAMVLARFRR
jgi:putative peptidoglycan lipid II flippase